MCTATQTSYTKPGGCKCKRLSITPCKPVRRKQRTIQRRFAEEVKDKTKSMEYDAPELESDWPTGCKKPNITIRTQAEEKECPDCRLAKEKDRYGDSNIHPDAAKRIRKLEYQARDVQPPWSDTEGEDNAE